MNKWGKKSLANYRMLHSDLKLLCDEVLKIHDCSIFQSYRDKETQNKYYANGTSKVKWPDSKHNTTPSDAVDLAPYVPGQDSYDMEHVLHFAGIVQAIAAKLYQEGLMSRRLIWGGSWRVKTDAQFAFDQNRFFDGIHFELE